MCLIKVCRIFVSTAAFLGKLRIYFDFVYDSMMERLKISFDTQGGETFFSVPICDGSWQMSTGWLLTRIGLPRSFEVVFESLRFFFISHSRCIEAMTFFFLIIQLPPLSLSSHPHTLTYIGYLLASISS